MLFTIEGYFCNYEIVLILQVKQARSSSSHAASDDDDDDVPLVSFARYFNYRNFQSFTCMADYLHQLIFAKR